MAAKIYIRLVNFKCFVEFDLWLTEGINMFCGDSGKGKTTVNKAIYFTLYGGRKFKNIQNRDHKDKPTMVSIHYQSEKFEWRITRTRPSESVTVEVRDANGSFTYKDAPGQDWINKQFGVENVWLSASYIGVTKPHFLVGGNTNAEKLELLRTITYGDSATENQPDTYIAAVNSAIVFYKERFNQLNDTIRVNDGVKKSYQTRNPLLITHPDITDEEALQMIRQRDSGKIDIERLRDLWSKLASKKQLVDYVATLPTYTLSLGELNKTIQTMNQQVKQIKLKEQLNDFDSKIYDVDMNVLSSDHFLYSRYINEGWQKTNLVEFIEEKKRMLKDYNDQQEIINKNKEIKANNEKKLEINNSLLSNYTRQMDDYNKAISDIKVYEKKKENIDKLKVEMGVIDFKKTEEQDDMSSKYVYDLNTRLCLQLEIIKNKVVEGEKYKHCLDEIKMNEQVLVVPVKINNEDDLTVNYTIMLADEFAKQTSLLSRRIDDLEELELCKSKLVSPVLTTNDDNGNPEFILEYRIHLTGQLNISNIKLSEQEERIKTKNIYDILIHEYSDIKCELMDDNDDNSYNFVQEYKVKLMMQINELTCPCCSHGLLLNNGLLIPGTVSNNSDESKQIRINKITLVEEEKTKRQKRDTLAKEIEKIKTKLNIVPELDINDIKSTINKCITELDLTKNEYENRKTYHSLKLKIHDLEQSDIKITSIEEIKNEINRIYLLITQCKNQCSIRQKYVTSLLSIEKLENKLLTFQQCDIEEEKNHLLECDTKIKDVKLEIEKRMKYDDTNRSINAFDSIKKPQTPSLPENPELLVLEQELLVKNLQKPTLEIFDIPVYQYDEYLKLWKSNSIKHIDQELKSIEVPCYDGSMNELDDKLKKNITLEIEMKKVTEERLRYKTMISTLPNDDPLIEQKYTELYNSIQLLEQKITLANEMKELRRIDNCIVEMTNELNKVVEYLGHFNYYYSKTEELGTMTLEKRIIDINEPLKEILDALFDEPISVKISPYKEMKNGNTKLQVNLIVEHKNSLVDDYDDECSTGQIGRISIALLLAFARNNSNPFIIIDEVLSSVEPSRQTDIIDILPSYSSGKFIINICHGVAEGNANNVIYFK